MYKNSGYLKDSIGVKSPAYILERNAVGYKVMDPNYREKIKRAAELHEMNRKIISKIKFFDRDIRQSLSTYLSWEFNASRVIIHDDSIVIDIEGGKKLPLEDAVEIEKLTGYTFDGTVWPNRYVFTKKDYDVDDIEGTRLWPDEIKKVQDYVKKGEESNE